MTNIPRTTSRADGLAAILSPIAADLEAVDLVMEELLKAPSARVRPLLDQVAHFRGKKLRPALAILAGRCFGPTGDTHQRLGAVVEMIHTATLVHDDVLDSGDRRRGHRTVNALWGNKTAILLGDFIFSTAFGLSASLENPLAARYLSWITGIVCQGEVLQILTAGDLDLPEEVYLDIIEKKTAYLFSASAKVGAEYSDAPPAAAKALAEYGMKLGTAFQIVDDCLDLAGTEDRVGKSLGTDAEQGKATLPVIHFLKTAGEADGAALRERIGTYEDEASRVAIRTMLEEHGSLAHALDRANDYVEDAIKVLGMVPDGEARDILEALARFSLRRER